MVKHSLLLLPVMAKIVESQWPGPLCYVVQGLFDPIIGHNGQERAEYFLAHDVHVVAGIQNERVW
ncbi:hypothetical protein D3C84_1057800 [compost metagenome]